MKTIVLAIILCSCSLVEINVNQRLNETKIRNEISLKQELLRSCLPPNTNVTLEISVDTNKQISYFKVVAKKKYKELTDCLFKELDLLYFKNINTSTPINIKYFLTSK